MFEVGLLVLVFLFLPFLLCAVKNRSISLFISPSLLRCHKSKTAVPLLSKPRYKVKLFFHFELDPPGVWFQELTMASLCGRLMLNAAKRNITYTPVRFCKSKFRPFLRWLCNHFFHLHRVPCDNRRFFALLAHLRNVWGRRGGTFGTFRPPEVVWNRVVELDSSKQFPRMEWFLPEMPQKLFHRLKILFLSPVTFRNFALCFCFSSDERPDWARDRSGEARAAGPPSRRHRSLRYACVQARPGHQGEPQHDPVRVRVAPRRMRLWVVLQCCFGILEWVIWWWLACFWD